MIFFTLVLLLLIGGYVLFVVRPLWVAFGGTRQGAEAQSDFSGNLGSILTYDAEDCDYDLLWRTQLPALKRLKRAGSGGASEAEMRRLYWDFGRRHPELADGSDLQTWLDALQDAGVAVYCSANERIIITEKGEHLLDILEHRVPII
jgi:hypothetical protein